jgi:hypothetical protein
MQAKQPRNNPIPIYYRGCHRTGVCFSFFERGEQIQKIIPIVPADPALSLRCIRPGPKFSGQELRLCGMTFKLYKEKSGEAENILKFLIRAFVA